jgi:hypothetical protein
MLSLLKSPTATKSGPDPTANGLPGAGVNEPETLAVRTVKVRVTGIAALKLPFPAWLAVIVQVPTLLSVTRSPAIVQTAGKVGVSVIGRPELAWAKIANGVTPRS